MSGWRLAAGGRIDRAATLPFRFDGRAYSGHQGDTLASALLANGVMLTGRSFKYHRPRGIVTAGPEEPCALVELRAGARREPNTPATIVELFAGLEAASQNRWPSLGFDLGALNGLAAPLLPAGFYYKTFMWPASFWERVYEPAIRRAAGLGRVADAPDPDRYEHVHDHCDVLVVGSGAAGLAAAQAAAAAGARVMLVEQDFDLGGGLLIEPGLEDFRRTAITALNGVTVLTRTTAVGAYDHGVFAAVERVGDHLPEGAPHRPRQRLHVIRARRAILATGAVERLVAFPGNDRPGVMLAGAARAYANRWGVAVGRRVVLFAANDEAYASARDLAAAGVAIAAIVDPRPESAAAEAARGAGLAVRSGHEVCGVVGGRALRGVRLRKVGGDAAETLAADALLMSGGFAPAVQLASQARARLAWNEDVVGFVPQDAGPKDDSIARSAGAARGVSGIGEAARDGEAAGREAAAALGLAAPQAATLPDMAAGAGTKPVPLWEVAAAGKSFVDLQNDVTAADLRLAHQEGYAHVEHAKRYTTLGMATDQGRVGGLVGSAVLAAARGVPVAAVGLPTFRPYATPVAWGALAGTDVGAHFKPQRLLPLHGWHQAHGAVFANVGLWKRPLVYSPSGDTSWGPVLEEARAVRGSVGMTDASSLGKIDLQGPDAAAFLDRIYANTFSTLPVGRARYGIMLREDGLVLDDGTTARLARDHFLMSTTTQKVTDVLEHMEWHLQVVWPELDVTLTNVSDHWAQFAVAGPKARDVLAGLVAGQDLANAAFPFMAVGEATIAKVPGRLFRISFSGELAYEVAVPATYAAPVWEAILDAGKGFAIRPYGLDALNVLRIEKGHVAGAELNGLTTPGDLGLGRMLKKSGDFVGRALGERPALRAPTRLQLVGIAPVDPSQRLRGGAHLVGVPGSGPSQGYLTSICMSDRTTSNGRPGWIGLALLAGGHARHGEQLVAASPVYGESVVVTVESPHRVDPENARVRA